MAFHPFEVNVVHLVYTLLGAFVVLFGLFSLLIKERLYIGEAVIATVIGIAFGPHGANLFSPSAWGNGHEEIGNEITLEVTRVVIAIGVFAVGVELPKAYMKRHWKSLAFLLGPVMVWGWMIAALLIWGLFHKMDYLAALVVAACVTPTDPILAQAVVGGKFADKHVPAHIRHLLSAESGCNDGAAFPFLYLALYLILDASDKHAVGEWFYITWLYEVALGTVIGAILGFSARKVMKFCERKNLIDRQSFVAQYVSLAVLSIGITTLLGSDDLLAAFACGTAFAWDGFFNKATEDSMFSNVIDLLFNCAAFIYIGAIIPFGDFGDAAIGMSVWRLFVLAICILLVRRLPVIMALYKWIPDIKTPREAAFVGWFGPMGVGAIFIATLARTKLPQEVPYPPEESVDVLARSIQPIVAFLVLTSILCHGLSIPFFSLSRRVHSVTHTWSRSSVDMRNEPAWATHARRINRGDNIRINRDDDNEVAVEDDPVADDGTADRGGGITEKELAEKGLSRDQQSSFGSSETRQGSGSGEDSNKLFTMSSRTGERSDVDAMERGEYRGASGSGSGSRATSLNEKADEEFQPEDGRRTPPLAEYREGDHLIIERKKGEGEEVEIEVIRHYFDDERDNESENFEHPHPLKHKEVDKLTKRLHDSLAHAVTAVRSHGAEEIDEMGLGMMGAKEIQEDEDEEIQRMKDNKKREENMGHYRESEETEEVNDVHTKQSPAKQAGAKKAVDRMVPTDWEEEGEASGSGEQNRERSSSPSTRRSSVGNNRAPAIFIHARPTGRRRDSIRRKILTNAHTSNEHDRSRSPAGGQLGEEEIEEVDEDAGDGEPLAAPEAAHLSRSSSRNADQPTSRGRPVLSPAGSTISSRSNASNQYPPRSSSPVRSTPAIRFATETAPSSDTVPSGMKAYAARSPSGGNAGLAMYRSSSVQSTDSQKSEKSKRFSLLGRFGGS